MRAQEERRGLLYQEQNHYIIGSLCGRVGEEWTEEREALLVAALCLSPLGSYRPMHKPDFNINRLPPLKQRLAAGWSHEMIPAAFPP